MIRTIIPFNGLTWMYRGAEDPLEEVCASCMVGGGVGLAAPATSCAYCYGVVHFKCITRVNARGHRTHSAYSVCEDCAGTD
jgi:hypothetical protein